jgi:hypothetical protein
MCGAGDARKLDFFLFVFLKREMLVRLVNFEKCHSPLRSWLSPTGTVSTRENGGGKGRCVGERERGKRRREKERGGRFPD